MDDVKKLFHNYLHLASGKAVLYGVIQFGVVMLLVRILSPDNYGNYVLFLSVASVLALFTTWTASSIVRFGREEYIKDGTVNRVFWANVWMLLPIFAITFGILMGLKGFISGYLEMSVVPIALMCSYIFASTLAMIFPVVFQAMGRMRSYSYLPVIFNIVVLVVLLVIYVGKIPMTVNMVFALVVSGHTISALVGLWLLRKYIFPVVFPLGTIKRCLSYSWSIPFGNISSQVVENVDQLVIGVTMANVYVGIYHIAYMSYNYAAILPMLSISLTFPLVTTLMLKKRHGDVKTYIRAYSPQIAFLWSLVTVVAIVFSREVVLVFGGSYATAGLPLMILLMGLSFRIFAIIESPITSAYGLIKQSVLVSVAIGALNLGLDWWLVPKIGIIGAAWGTAISCAIGVVGHSWVVRHYLGLNDFRNYRWVFPAVIAFGICWYVPDLWARVLAMAVVVTGSLTVAKTAGLFNNEFMMLVDAVDMPKMLKTVIGRGYALVS